MNDGTDDECNMDEHADGCLAPDFRRRKDELGEDDPEGDGDDQDGTLGN